MLLVLPFLIFKNLCFFLLIAYYALCKKEKTCNLYYKNLTI